MTTDYRELARAFEAGTLDAAGFSHADHIGVAWQLLGDHDFIEASHRYVTALRAFAARAGVPQKFNMTITMAFMSLIAERKAASEVDDFETFLAENSDLITASLLDRWYSKDRLMSDLGRSVYLMPDKAAELA